jgi:hypothetical protein
LVAQKEIHNDEAQLRAAGFDATAPPPDAIAKLRELRGTPGVSDKAIARALGILVDPAAAAMLTEMEAGASGQIRREIRRALFRLKQHGIDAPVGSTRPATAAPAPDVSGLTALLSPIDPDGARIVWILKPRMQGGVIRLWALVSEEEGLVGAQNTGLSRRELKSEREQIEQRANMKLYEADWRLADFITNEAYRHTPGSRRGQVGNFLAVRAELIASPPPTDFTHPVYRELAQESAGEPSVELLQYPELSEWRLPQDVIKPYVDEIGSVGESLIVLNPMQKQERINEVVERAIAELLSGDSARRIRRRLEDIAYYMLRTAGRLESRRTTAGWAAAAAAKLRDGGDVRQIPFFQAFVRTQLGAFVAAEEQKAAEEPRLIMTPAEAMRAQQARQARMRSR